MRIHLHRSTSTENIVCALIFLTFTFCYLWCYQSDMLYALQHNLSDGATTYNRTIGALLITAILGAANIGVGIATRLSCQARWLNYFPSFLFLAIITDMHIGLHGMTLSTVWLWLCPLLMAVWLAGVWLARQVESVAPLRTPGPLLGLHAGNIFFLSVMAVGTAYVGTGQSVLHFRAHAEVEMMNNRPAEALKAGASPYGNNTADTDSSLTMLRIWALSQQQQLGEHLFTYRIVGGADAMFPDGKTVRLLLLPEKRLWKHLGGYVTDRQNAIDRLEALHASGKATKAAHDYLLTAYLLAGRIDDFARTLKQYYTINDALPRHYREALVLHTHQRQHPVAVYHNAVMDADYDDFQQLITTNPDTSKRLSLLRDSYGQTYWYYYYTLKHNYPY